MKSVCFDYHHGKLPLHLSALSSLPLETELRNVAYAFVQLQEARHSADYDVATPLDKTDVLQKISLAEKAFSDWESVKSGPNASVFLAALLLNSQWRK